MRERIMKATTGHRKALGITALAILAGFVTVSRASAGDVKLDSQWRNTAITVDGQDSDWESGRVYLKDIKGALGVVNDGEYLYLSLSTNDEGLSRQILYRGLIVWFDPDGGHDKMFGLQYPVRRRGEGFRRPPGDEDEPRERPDPGQFQQRMLDSIPSLLTILDSKGEATDTVNLGPDQDIQAQMHMEGERLTYEMRIPLSYSTEHSFAIATTPGAKIGIGLETPKFSFDGHGGGGMHGGFGGGMKGGDMSGGGMGGHGDHGMRGQRPDMGDPLKLWSEVQLATDQSHGSLPAANTDK